MRLIVISAEQNSCTQESGGFFLCQNANPLICDFSRRFLSGS
jgi:hypothetical protein